MGWRNELSPNQHTQTITFKTYVHLVSGGLDNFGAPTCRHADWSSLNEWVWMKKTSSLWFEALLRWNKYIKIYTYVCIHRFYIAEAINEDGKQRSYVVINFWWFLFVWDFQQRRVGSNDICPLNCKAKRVVALLQACFINNCAVGWEHL